MKTLKDLRAGDPVIVTDANLRARFQQATVTKVGRKYLTVGRDEYDLSTGLLKGKTYGGGRYAYTVEAWERRELESRYRRAVRDFEDALHWGGSLAHMTGAELNAGIDTFRAMQEKLAAKAGTGTV